IQNKKQMCCPAMARILSNTLFYKRFFFLIKVYNVLGGLDNDGKRYVYTYDAVGSYEKVGNGSGGSESKAVDLIKTCFASATDRDIYRGHKLENCHRECR
ncbi:hypothetical protein CUMW_131600, partial [Citrus unshiu]